MGKVTVHSVLLAVIAALGVLSSLLGGAAYAQVSRYFDRNSITASGDNNINAIATGASEVIVVLNSNQEPESYTTSQYARYIAREKPEFYSEAEQEHPGESPEFIEALAIAKFLFSQGQYSASAGMFERSLNLIGRNDEGRRTIEGMVTASYYGSARHLEGLKFICRQYEWRPKWNFEFRHAIHAHLRSLAVNMGHDEAEKILNHVRQNPKCRRLDFSPVWIPIHLVDMRWLEQSSPPTEVRYGISKEDDLAYAKRLLREGNHGFIDYLYFVLGDFPTVIRRFPNSYVIDLALLGNGENPNYLEARTSLLDYINRFERHRLLAIQTLLRRSQEAGDRETRTALLDNYGDQVFAAPESGAVRFQINDHTRVWFPDGEVKELAVDALAFMGEYYSSCQELVQWLHSGQINNAIEFSQSYLERYPQHFSRDYNLQGYFGLSTDTEYSQTCLVELRRQDLQNLVNFLTPVDRMLRSGDVANLAQSGTELKLCGDAREAYLRGKEPERFNQFCDRLLETIWDLNLTQISFHKLSAVLLRRANELDPIGQSNSLFLAGLALRNTRDYQGFIETMEQYATYYPQEKFADDALTEIGWYHLAIAANYAEADRYFLRVMDEYPSANAYDNALNWLVISKRAQGDLVSASYYSAQLLSTVASDRLSRKISGRHEEIASVANAMDPDRAIYVVGEELSDFIEFFGVSRRLVVADVARGANQLEVGQRITQVNGEYIADLITFHRYLANARSQGFADVTLTVAFGPYGSERKTVQLPLGSFGF